MFFPITHIAYIFQDYIFRPMLQQMCTYIKLNPYRSTYNTSLQLNTICRFYKQFTHGYWHVPNLQWANDTLKQFLKTSNRCSVYAKQYSSVWGTWGSTFTYIRSKQWSDCKVKFSARCFLQMVGPKSFDALQLILEHN